MIMDDAVNGLSESATFCKSKDDKRPSLVGLPDGSTKQVCPIDGSEVKDGVKDAYPQGWFVRVMFDELLDPSVEDLTEILDDNGLGTGTYSGSIAASHPVNLKCTGISGAMVDIPYDGYYSPSGNNVTWPLGPSLVIKPNLPATVPINAHCQISINDNVADKDDGNKVPSEQRGPYTFEISGIKVAFVAPADGDSLDPVDGGMDVLFNTIVDPHSVDDAMDWTFDPDLSTNPVLGRVVGATAVGAATIDIDECAPETGILCNFEDGEPGCDTTNAATGGTGACDMDITIDGETVHVTQIDYANDPVMTYTLASPTTMAHADTAAATTPLNNTFSLGFGANGAQLIPAFGSFLKVGGKDIGAPEWLVIGDYKAETDYEWTLPMGVKLKDMCGVESTFSDAPTVANNRKVAFSTNKLTFTGITPTDGTMAANPGAKIQLKFNQTMNPDSLGGRCTVSKSLCYSDDQCGGGADTCGGLKFTITPALDNIAVIQDLTDGSKLDVYGDYKLDTDYTFTIQAGTQIAECPGGETTNAVLLSSGSPPAHGGVGTFGIPFPFYGNACDVKDVKSFTITDAQTVKFHTAAAIALTGQSPADNATITKPVAVGSTARNSIRLTFNQEMDPTSLVQGPTGFDIEPNVPMKLIADSGNFRTLKIRSLLPNTGPVAMTCAGSSANCTGFAPGTYTFTFHQGATVKDFLGNTFTNPADVVIHFTIKDPDPQPDCLP